MTSFNVANVIDMLATTFQIASITQTAITPFEIEVHDEIRDVIQNCHDIMCLILLIHQNHMEYKL